MSQHTSQYFNPPSSDEEDPKDENQSFLQNSPTNQNDKSHSYLNTSKINKKDYEKQVKKTEKTETPTNQGQQQDNQEIKWSEKFWILFGFIGLLVTLFFICGILFRTFREEEYQKQQEELMKRPVIKPITDKNEYKTIILPNKLKILLISDPESKLSYASMDINAGSWLEPNQVPGLAHYLEHMLFLANEKYPETAYFDDFLSKNGGYSNAYTTDLHTNFYFHSDSNSFEQALDIFSHMFISPTFVRESAEKEAQNVESEYLLDVNDDGWMIQNLITLQCKPEHPMSRFTIGTVDTLINQSKAQNIEVLDSLEQFFKEKYSSNLMTLALYSNQSIEDLEQIVENVELQKINNSKLSKPDIYVFGLPFDKQNINTILKIQTTSGIKTLNMVFELEGIENQKKRGLEYFMNLINYQGQNSFVDVLKSENLINDMSYDILHKDEALLLFQFQFALTNSGFKNPQQIINAFYAYLDKIQKEGIQEGLYNDMKIQSQSEFDYQLINNQNQQFDEKISQYSSYMNTFNNIPEVLAQDYIYEEFDKEYIESLIKEIKQRNNSFFILGSDDFFVDSSQNNENGDEEQDISQMNQIELQDNQVQFIQQKSKQSDLQNEELSETNPVEEQNQQNNFDSLYTGFIQDNNFILNELYNIKYAQIQLSQDIMTELKETPNSLIENVQFPQKNQFAPENKNLVSLCPENLEEQTEELFLGSQYIQDLSKKLHPNNNNSQSIQDNNIDFFDIDGEIEEIKEKAKENTEIINEEKQQLHEKFTIYTKDYFQKFLYTPFIPINKTQEECLTLQNNYFQKHQQQYPSLINKNTFYKMDLSYQIPYVSMSIYLEFIYQTYQVQDIKTQMSQKIIGELLNQKLQNKMAEPLNFDYNLSVSTLFQGYIIGLEGWSDRFEEFLDLFVQEFDTIEIEEQEFLLAKNIIKDSIQESYQQDALHQAFSNSLHMFLVVPSFNFQEQITAIENVNLDEITQFFQEMKNSFKVKQLITGNILPFKANKLSKTITQKFQIQQLPVQIKAPSSTTDDDSILKDNTLQNNIEYDDGEQFEDYEDYLDGEEDDYIEELEQFQQNNTQRYLLQVKESEQETSESELENTLEQEQQENKQQQQEEQVLNLENEFLFSDKKQQYIKKLSQNQSFAFRQYLDGSEENQNSATLNYYQYGQRSLKSFATMHLLVDILNSHAYNYLRTERELGYVAFCTIVSHGCVDGFVIGVEGAKSSPQVVDEMIEQSLMNFESKLAEITSEEFDHLKQSINQSLSEKKHSLSEQQKQFLDFIIDETYSFDLNEQAAYILKEITIVDLIQMFEQIFKQDIGKVSIQRYSKATQENGSTLQINKNPLDKEKSLSRSDQIVLTDISELNLVQKTLPSYECQLQQQ